MEQQSSKPDSIEGNAPTRLPTEVSRTELRFVVAVTSVVAVLYSVFAMARVWTMRANAFDAGFVDNLLWKVSRGLGDLSGLTGLNHFVDHASPLLLLALPLYWVVPDDAYLVLLVVQAISVASVAVAGWLIAISVGLESRMRSLVFIFLILNVGLFWATITELHMTGISVGLLAMTVAGAYRRWSTSWYWVLPFLASAARIEVALGVVIAGMLLRRVSQAHARVTTRIGLGVTVVLGLWMVLAPHDGSSFGGHFAYLDVRSALEVPLAVMTNLGAVWDQLTDPRLLWSVGAWIVIVGAVLPVRGMRWYLISVPILLIPVLGSHHGADFWFEHYWNLLIVSTAVAVPVSLATRWLSLRAVGGVVATTLILGWVMAGPSSGPESFKPLDLTTKAGGQRVVEIIGPDLRPAMVPNELVLPLAHREWVYRFPTPFACAIDQDAVFTRAGPRPEWVVVPAGWEDRVNAADVPTVGFLLDTHYALVEVAGHYAIYRFKGGPGPLLIYFCDTVS